MPTRLPTRRRRRPRVPAVLRDEPAFRLLFTGQAFSVVGDRVAGIVLPFAVLSIGGGVTGVAVVSAAQFLPFAFLALPAGVWADRLDRRMIMLVSDGVRLLSQLLAAVALLTDVATVPVLAVLALGYGAADAFFAPAVTGLLPSTVRPENIQPANAMRGLSFSTSSVLGPVLAGLLITISGPGGALLFDVATFVVSMVCLAMLRTRHTPPASPAAEPEPFLAQLRQGWAEVRSRPWVGTFLGGMCTYHVAVLPAIFVLGPVLADRELGGARAWAVVTTCFGIGALLGDALLLRWRPRFALRTSALMLVGASCQAAIIGSGLPLAGIAGLELLAGVCVTGFFTLWETSLQEHIPSASLSRVSSYDYLVSVGLLPLGNLAAGGATSILGLHTTLLGMSVIGIGAALLVLSARGVRELPRGVEV